MSATSAFAQIKGLPNASPDQGSRKFKPNVVRQTGPARVETTYRFFPQIDRSIGAKGIQPEHKNPPFGLPAGKPNNMVAGGISGPSAFREGPKFAGLEFGGLIPPDPHIGVGPNHVVQGVNTKFGFYDKTTGALQFSQDTATFFSSLGAPTFHSDPRAYYDQFNGHWIVLILSLDFTAEESYILIGTSDDDDPNGTWNLYQINAEVNIGGTDMWLDYPMVGYNKDALVVCGNMFGFSSGFGGAQAFVIPTAGLYSGAGSTATGFSVGGNSIQPADGYDPTTDFVYAMQTNTSTTIRLYAFGNFLTTPSMVQSAPINVAQYGTSPAAPSGGGGSIDTLSSRILSGSYRAGSLLGCHSVLLPGTSRCSVRWYQFDPGTWPTSGTPSLTQQGNITLPGSQWALMPAIAENANGDISIIYTRSSTSIVSDLVVSTRRATDPAGVMGAPTLLKSGVSPSVGGRWGDYFACVIDPNDDVTFWGDGEVTRADGLWTTEIQSWVVLVIIRTEYDALGISTIQGTFTGGGLAQITTSDDSYYTVDSVLVPGVGYFATNQVDFTISEPVPSILELKFTMEAHATPTSTVTGTFFLWNWTTSAFEFVNTFSLGTTDTTVPVSLTSNFAKYINGAGQIRMALRAHDPFRRAGARPQPFTFAIDYVHLQVAHL